ncbi:MAG: alpha/beta fold hydrolase [Phycisphaerales bacterium]|nr:alpha/beta fold hydrolase [Phycisphaerales bacterium]
MRPPLFQPQLAEWKLSDGYVTRGRVWEPVRRPRVVRIYLHGIQSHSGWYQWSSSILAGDDCVVVAPDRRGSGMNEVARGDTPHPTRWLDDVSDLCDWIDERYHSPPIELIGMSWGGKLAAACAIQSPRRFERLLLITPGIYPRVNVPMSRIAAIALNMGVGGRGLFEIPLNDPALFTDNAGGRAFIANDPLRLTHATARFLAWSARLDGKTRRAKHGAINASVTMLLAGSDEIVHNEPLRAWSSVVPVAPAKIVDFPADAHTLEFAADTADFERAIRMWAESGR